MGGGWGRCVRCRGPLPSLIMRVVCDSCREKDRKRAALDRKAVPDKLRNHPDLAELDLILEAWYG